MIARVACDWIQPLENDSFYARHLCRRRPFRIIKNKFQTVVHLQDIGAIYQSDNKFCIS